MLQKMEEKALPRPRYWRHLPAEAEGWPSSFSLMTVLEAVERSLYRLDEETIWENGKAGMKLGRERKHEGIMDSYRGGEHGGEWTVRRCKYDFDRSGNKV